MIDTLLSRLNKVRPRGNGQFMACCPAHDDRSPSLSIRAEPDGRILVNCLAGCSAESIIERVGMEMKDLMPERIEHHIAPVKQRIFPADAMRVIQFEARIVMVAGFELKKGKPLSDEDAARLGVAMERINKALEMANVSA